MTDVALEKSIEPAPALCNAPLTLEFVPFSFDYSFSYATLAPSKVFFSVLCFQSIVAKAVIIVVAYLLLLSVEKTNGKMAVLFFKVPIFVALLPFQLKYLQNMFLERLNRFLICVENDSCFDLSNLELFWADM